MFNLKNRLALLSQPFIFLLLMGLTACPDTSIVIPEEDALPGTTRSLPIFQNGYSFYPIAPQAAISTDQRPTPIGVYDTELEQTFITWMGQDSNPFIQAFDHSSMSWTNPKRVGSVTESPNFRGADSHNYPSFLKAKDGHLLVFFANHSDRLWVSRSPEAKSLEGSWEQLLIPEAARASYAFPVLTDNGDIYVFYRESSFQLREGLRPDDRPVQWVRSQDNGRTWQSSKSIAGVPIALGSWDRDDNLDEIYMGQVRHQSASAGVSERIHMVWMLAGGGIVLPPGVVSPHNQYHKDVYYAYFQPDNQHFYCADGRDLGRSINKINMHHCRVEDTGPLDVNARFRVGYIQLVHYQDNGRPLVVYRLQTSSGPVLRTAHWRQGGWFYKDIPGDGYPLDLEKTGAESFTLYLGQRGIRQYSTTDSGNNWSFQSFAPMPPARPLSKLIVIENYREPARLLVTSDTQSLSPSADIYLVGLARCNSTGRYRLRNAWTGRYLSSHLESAVATTTVPDLQSQTTSWTIMDVGNGYCKIRADAQDGYLSSNADSIQLKAHLDSADAAQRWLIVAADNGVVKLKSADGSFMQLNDDPSFSLIATSSYGDDPQQDWILESID